MDSQEIGISLNLKTKISCLPVAGPENPYQRLMMDGLKSNPQLDVKSGVAGKFLVILRTCLKQKSNFIHFDWISRYFVRNPGWLSYIHGPLFLLELLFVKHVLKCDIVWTLHNLSRHDVGWVGIEGWVKKQFAKNCTWVRVFDNSTALKASRMLKISKERFCVVPEGSFVELYPNYIGSVEARAKLFIEEHQVVFLYLGNLRPYKGVDYLVDAFNKVKKDNWLLLIAGKPLDKQYSDLVKSKCQGNPQIVMEPRFIQEHELGVYFNACDFVVYPFRRVENSGAVIMAMGFKKPIIAPHTGVLESRLSNQRGLLYKNQLTETLALASEMSRDQKEHIGQLNFSSLGDHHWHDFALLFTESYHKRTN